MLIICSLRVSYKQLVSLAVCIVMLVAIGIVMAVMPEASANGTSETARLQFLQSLGYGVEPGSGTMEKVRLPEPFDAVFEEYNELQKQAGYNLAPYSGRVIERWSYPLGQNRTEEAATAHLLVCEGCIVGGDIEENISGGYLYALVPKTEIQ